jgi:hypothetical protein
LLRSSEFADPLFQALSVFFIFSATPVSAAETRAGTAFFGLQISYPGFSYVMVLHVPAAAVSS